MFAVENAALLFLLGWRKKTQRLPISQGRR